MVGNYLTQVGSSKIQKNGFICLALAHNEGLIIDEFLRHYRALGQISFLIVDDHSDDGSTDFFKKQPDVTLFQPNSNSTYSQHKKIWRSTLLDHFADNQWCLVPDIDEHFVYLDIESKPLATLVDELENEGSEALFSLMVDMYADKPLKDHIFPPNKHSRLLDEFPLFDGDTNPPLGYRLMRPPKRFLRKYPTPKIIAYGGLRDRLFLEPQIKMNLFQKFLLNRFANMGRPINPDGVTILTNAITRILCKKLFSSNPYNSTKLVLLRWQRGLEFSGGAHSVNRNLALSNRISAVLHYKFTRGLAGIKYSAKRGQHAGGSLLIKRMLEDDEILCSSPVCASTKKYVNSHSLAGILR